MGLSGSAVGLFATRIYGIVKLVACFIFIVFVTDTLGRRKSLIWTGTVQVGLPYHAAILFSDIHSFARESCFSILDFTFALTRQPGARGLLLQVMLH